MNLLCMHDARIVAMMNRFSHRVQLRHGMDVFSVYDAILWSTATVAFAVWVYGLYPVLHAENEWYVTFGVLQILIAILLVWMCARGEQLITAQARTVAYIASEQGVCNPVSSSSLFIDLRCKQIVLTVVSVLCAKVTFRYTVLVFIVALLQAPAVALFLLTYTVSLSFAGVTHSQCTFTA
jgi:hypothetical protein